MDRNDTLLPSQFYVEQRVRTFETVPGVRNFRLSVVAEKVAIDELRHRNIILKTTGESEANAGVEKEDLNTMLDDLNFRFSGVHFSPPNEKTEDATSKEPGASHRASSSLMRGKSSKGVKSTSTDSLQTAGSKSEWKSRRPSVPSIQSQLDEEKVKEEQLRTNVAVRSKAINTNKIKQRRKKELITQGKSNEQQEDAFGIVATEVGSKISTVKKFRGFRK